MEHRLQLRVQRYGWDLAAGDYEAHWRASLASAQVELLAGAALQPGEKVLDVACGTGLVSFAAAAAVGRHGSVLGVDLSEGMVKAAQSRGESVTPADTASAGMRFLRMDAQELSCAAASFDVTLCALGLMYVPDPDKAIREMWRVLRPGGRLALLVWGERSRCGWSEVFPIVDAEVASDVCPLFFRLGGQDALERACASAAFEDVRLRRFSGTLDYGDEHAACEAAFIGGPVALAWSRFDRVARARVRERYLDAIRPWKQGAGYRVPVEFVMATAVKSACTPALAAPSGPR